MACTLLQARSCSTLPRIMVPMSLYLMSMSKQYEQKVFILGVGPVLVVDGHSKRHLEVSSWLLDCIQKLNEGSAIVK
jgi:hypothetical protein